jgi:hypothetical protein
MQTVIEEIQGALNVGLYYLAIAIALTLPDMCAALESSNGETSGPKYRDWYRNNLQAKYPRISETDIYKLRCAVLHQAKVSHDKMDTYSRVVFSLPHPQHISAHMNVSYGATALKGILNLDAVTFCNDMIRAALEWSGRNMGNRTVQENLPLLVQRRSMREMGFDIGVEVIA